MILRNLLAAIIVVATATVARADSDTLQPTTFESVRADLKKALSRVAIRDDVTPKGCLDGGTTKRTVCTFKIASYLMVMAESKIGEKDVVAITMICGGTETLTEAAKCLLGYKALIAATSPGISEDARDNIVATLMKGLDVGNQVTIQTDERKFMLQKSMGLWFHVIAADGEGT